MALIEDFNEEEEELTLSPEVALGGLGLGGAFYANQLGNPTPKTAPILSKFAQQVQADDALRLGQKGLPNLVGKPSVTSTLPRIMGSGSSVYTGTPNARPVPGTVLDVKNPIVPTGNASTSIVPTRNATTSIVPTSNATTSLVPTSNASTSLVSTAQPTPQATRKPTASDFDFKIGQNTLRPNSLLGGLGRFLKFGAGGAVSEAIAPTPMGDSTIPTEYFAKEAQERLGRPLTNQEQISILGVRGTPRFDELFPESDEYYQRKIAELGASDLPLDSFKKEMAFLQQRYDTFKNKSSEGAAAQAEASMLETIAKNNAGELTPEEYAAGMDTSQMPDPNGMLGQREFPDQTAYYDAVKQFNKGDADLLENAKLAVQQSTSGGLPGEGPPQVGGKTIDVDAMAKENMPNSFATGTIDTVNNPVRSMYEQPNGVTMAEYEDGTVSPLTDAKSQYLDDYLQTRQQRVQGFGRGGDAGVFSYQPMIKPMGSEETQARLGGKTLSEYLNAPNGVGVSGLRTDPQGRMIPGGNQSRGAAYSDYEYQAQQRMNRMDEQDALRGQSTGSQNVPRDVRIAAATPAGRRTLDQIKRLADYQSSTMGESSGGVGNVVQSFMSPSELRNEALRNDYLEAQIYGLQQSDPTAYAKAASVVQEYLDAGGKGDFNKLIAIKLGFQDPDDDFERLAASIANKNSSSPSSSPSSSLPPELEAEKAALEAKLAAATQ